MNLTPHDVVIQTPDGNRAVIMPRVGSDGKVAPALVSSTPGALLKTFHGIPIYGSTVYGAVRDLPDPSEGMVYIVSSMVLNALKGTRPDVVAPGTGPQDGAIRFADGPQKGQVEAVTRLVS